MPTLESSLREAVKAGLTNDTVHLVKGEIAKQTGAVNALRHACESNEELDLNNALKRAMKNGLGASRLAEEAQRRLDGFAMARQRAKNIELARKLRDSRKGPTSSQSLPKLAVPKRRAARTSQIPLLGLARMPPQSLTTLVPKHLPIQVADRQPATSPKVGELFLKGASVLCEQTAEGHSILELNLRAAATSTDADLAPAVERVGRARALFAAAQKAAELSYGALELSSMQALEIWLQATENPEEAVKEVHQRLHDAHLDFLSATKALTAHRSFRPNQDIYLVQCKEQEGVARAMLTRGRAKLKDLGIPMTPDVAREWDVSILAGRLERLGHFLFQPKAELEHYNLQSARAGVARACVLLKALGPINEAEPDPILALMAAALEVMDHPLVRRIFSESTTFAVGAKTWTAESAPMGQSSKPVSPPRSSLSLSSSVPLLTEDIVLPRGFFVAPRASTGSTGAGRLRDGATNTASMSSLGVARDEASRSSQPALLSPSPLPSPPQSARNGHVDGLRGSSIVPTRVRTTTPARSQFHIKVDESLGGMNGSGRVLELELKRFRTELEMRLHPPSLATAGLDFDPSGLIRTLLRALQAWQTRHDERERHREEERGLTLLAVALKKRATAYYSHSALDEAGAKSVMEQLRKQLANNLARTMDFFRNTDTDQSGKIDRREFRRAVAKIVPGVTKGICAALFDLLDTDGSDSLEYEELHSRLRVTLESARPGEHKAGRRASASRPSFERMTPTAVGKHLLLRSGEGNQAVAPSH